MKQEQIKELAELLQCGNRCFVHKETKQIVTFVESDSFWHDDDVWAEARAAVRNNAEEYVEILPMDGRRAFRVMEDFIETVADASLREKLEEALRRPKPYANFKFDINNSDYRQKWFDFAHKQMLAWVTKSLVQAGLYEDEPA